MNGTGSPPDRERRLNADRTSAFSGCTGLEIRRRPCPSPGKACEYGADHRDDGSHEESGDDRSLSKTFHRPERNERDERRGAAERGVEADLHGPESRAGLPREEFDNGIRRMEQGIGREHHADPQGEDGAPEDKREDLIGIAIGGREYGDDHPEIDEDTEHQADEDLQELLPRKLPPQDQELQEDEKDPDQKGETPRR